jgi:hypothetical protein
MIINNDLRMAIKAKCEQQPTDNHAASQKSAEESIQSFLKSQKGQRAKALIRREVRASKSMSEAVKALAKEFGLRLERSHDSNSVRFSYGDDSTDRFKKAGGKLAKPLPPRWQFSQVMAEVAAATPADGVKILRKYGINWA